MGQVGLSHLPGLISMTQKRSVAEIFPSGPERRPTLGNEDRDTGRGQQTAAPDFFR